MKKITNLLIVCSLALAGAALAQKPDEQTSPKGKRQAPAKAPAARQAQPRMNAAKPQGRVAKPEGAPTRQRVMPNNRPAAAKTQDADAARNTNKAARTERNAPDQPAATAAPVTKRQAEKQTAKGASSPAANAKVAATPAPTAAPTNAKAAATAAPTVAAARQGQPRPNTAAATKKPAPQKVQQIKQQHANFHAQPKPQKVPPVRFSQNYRIHGSDRWQGRQYERFRSYHPERHDRGWYHQHHNRVVLIGGGYYYWDNNYWYPAWGYDPANEYYAYDAPIYVGSAAEPPDQVIANVQSALQEMGYYKGEVDGLLGPLTRDALTAYQSDQGLTATAVIDEPTLDSLGMG